MPPKTTTQAPAAKPAAKKAGATKKGPMKKTKGPLGPNPLFPARAIFQNRLMSVLREQTYPALFFGQSMSDSNVKRRSYYKD